MSWNLYSGGRLKDTLVRLVKRRYIAFRLKHAPYFSKRELLMMFMSNVEGVGREGSEEYHIRIIEYDPSSGLGIIRCDHRAVSLLLNVLKDPTKTLGKYDAETIGVSGSIKTLKRKFLQA